MTNSQFTINNSTPTLVFSGTGKVLIRGQGFIGGSGVTSSTGYLLSGSTTLLELSVPTDVYAITASGTEVVYVLSWY